MRAFVLGTIITALMTTGCASHYAAALTPVAPSARMQTSPAVWSKYVAALPAGSRVRVELSDGRVVKGTLMDVEGDRLVLQRRSRIPEAPEQIPLTSIARVEIDHGSNIGRSIAIGAGAGASAALGVFFIILAMVD